MSGLKWRLQAAGLLLAGLVLAWLLYPQSAPNAEEMARKASLLAARGDTAAARELAEQCLQASDTQPDALLLLGQLDFAASDWAAALQHLLRVSADDQPQWVAARQLAATIYHRHVFQLSEAEAAYRDVLSVRPQDPQALENCAQLLGLCGRRTEAIPLVLKLIKGGHDTDLLMLLSRESGSLTDPQLLQAAARASPQDPNPLLGLTTAAMLDLDFAAAQQTLDEAIALSAQPPVLLEMRGRVLLATEQTERLMAWAAALPDERSAEVWFVLAELSERLGDTTGALRCCWEGLKQRPESLAAMNQMARLLTAEGRPEEASLFFERVEQLNAFRGHQRLAIMSEERPTFEQFLAMINSYHQVGRHWEALAWGRLAREMQPDHGPLNDLLSRIEATVDRLPLQLTVDAANPALAVDLSDVRLPSLQSGSATQDSTPTSPEIAFVRQTTEVGFDFQYFAGSDQVTNRMYEFGGGGIGVIDFDHDGWPDVYCTQGEQITSPITDSQTHHDGLFRNLRQRLMDVSREAGLQQVDQFGQGVAAGDVNGDGFADLYVAGTQHNQLWLNNGDGTFTAGDRAFSQPASEWTTSCLLADLNGDGHTDIYDVNYLTGERVFERLCAGEHGQNAMCSPYDFDAAVDRVWLSDGAGGWQSAADFLQPPPAGKGLGIVAFNGGDDRLSLFVSNDTVANFFYTASTAVTDTMRESALTAGLAFNGDGKAEACMGIAAGDGDGDGAIDLLVTNFLHESNTLYSAAGPGVFRDRTRELGLQEPSLPVLGWGTQFLDANLDGRQELFVANGYTHDLSRFDTPYAMRAHLYEFTQERFTRLPIAQLGEWADQKFVARAAARLDWNRDGRCDLAVGMLQSPSCLLTNTTETTGRFLSLNLVATDSARDALGTVIRLANSDSVHQLTAGDGYQASNQRCVLIGCGDQDRLSQITIQWPSGRQQVLTDVATNTQWTLVEGRRPVIVPR